MSEERGNAMTAYPPWELPIEPMCIQEAVYEDFLWRLKNASSVADIMHLEEECTKCYEHSDVTRTQWKAFLEECSKREKSLPL